MNDATETPSTDYIAARQEWLERYGSYIASARNWRLAAFFSIAVAALGVGGAVYEGGRTHIVPYVVETDHLGQSVRLGQAIAAGAFEQPIITHVLANWITDARTRTSDDFAEHAMVYKAYDYVDQDAQLALGDYFKKHDAFSGATNGPVTVTIESALPDGKLRKDGGTYQISWTETQHDTENDSTSVQHWKSIVSYSILPSKDETAERLVKNPFGIYITSFQWQKTL